jgi:replicative DNA helicase
MARAVCAEAGRPPLVVLDYVQRLADPSTEERRGAVSELSGRLRDLSRPDPAHGWPGCAVLALSSVGRGHYDKFTKCDTLASATDLEGTGKESGELEYDAPVVLALTSDTDDDGAMVRQALLRVVKNREGSPGKVWMRFDAPRGLFREAEAPGVPSARPDTGKTPVAGGATSRSRLASSNA